MPGRAGIQAQFPWLPKSRLSPPALGGLLRLLCVPLTHPTPLPRDFVLGVFSVWDALLSPFLCPISISSPSEPALMYLLELRTSWSRYFCYFKKKFLWIVLLFLVDCKLHGGRPAHPVYSLVFHAWHTAAYLMCLLFWWMNEWKHGSQWSTHAELFFLFPAIAFK